MKGDIGGLNRHKLYRMARRRGDFDTGYHYILQTDGTLEADREKTAVAGWNLQAADVSLYILADAPEGKISDAQRVIIRSIAAEYPNAEIIERDSEKNG